jgi:hypothetical protein
VPPFILQGEIFLPFYYTTCACGAADKPLGFDETYHSDIAERFTQDEWTEIMRGINHGFTSRLAKVAKYFSMPAGDSRE